MLFPAHTGVGNEWGRVPVGFALDNKAEDRLMEPGKLILEKGQVHSRDSQVAWDMSQISGF